ncbi:unnamed protein product [Gongylonema pulchrum]|uniref:Sm domain-containing protein n=1 Tax=Gongylonema pulchrum TaxID=637853 RepID=A0A183DRR6_9BILA|nr:unnamed protein product [Gongylonema pulchrum]
MSKFVGSRKQQRSAVTPIHFLNCMQGFSIAVDLKDYSVVEGILINCDNDMNMEMGNVTVHRWGQQKEPVHCDNFHITGKCIRFVHLSRNDESDEMSQPHKICERVRLLLRQKFILRLADLHMNSIHFRNEYGFYCFLLSLVAELIERQQRIELKIRLRTCETWACFKVEFEA